MYNGRAPNRFVLDYFDRPLLESSRDCNYIFGIIIKWNFHIVVMAFSSMGFLYVSFVRNSNNRLKQINQGNRVRLSVMVLPLNFFPKIYFDGSRDDENEMIRLGMSVYPVGVGLRNSQASSVKQRLH